MKRVCQSSGPLQENPPHRDAIFGVVEPLQGSQVVGQRVRVVPGEDRDDHGGRLHPRLLRGPFLGKITLAGVKQSQQKQKVEKHGGSPDAAPSAGRVSSPRKRRRGRGRRRKKKGIPNCLTSPFPDSESWLIFSPRLSPNPVRVGVKITTSALAREAKLCQS